MRRRDPILRLLTLATLALLAGCGGSMGSQPTQTPCPVADGVPDPGGGTNLRGFVFEGEGTDGKFSGRPMACVTVIVEAGASRWVLQTDRYGFFDVGSTPVAFNLHVLPPSEASAAAVSIFDLTTASTGQVLRVYLPLRRSVGGPTPRDPGTSLTLAVRGRLLDAQGNPQVGAFPPGGVPGEPGSIGFVWWGAYGTRAGSDWVDSGITDTTGRFSLWTGLGGEVLGRTRPFFAGNYDGRSPAGDLLFFTQFTFRPAVDVLAGQVTDLGTLQLSRVDQQVNLLYDATAQALLASWGPNGLGFTFVKARLSPGAQDLELARAFNGPYQGGIRAEQSVPVPRVVVGSAQALYALSYAFDATVTDGTGELSVTQTPSGSSQLLISFIAPPRNFAWDGSRRFTWTTLLNATLYEVNVRDDQNLPVWIGVRGAGQNEAALPFTLARGRYFAYVAASDSETPAARATRIWSTFRKLPGSRRSPYTGGVRALADGSGGVRHSFSRTILLSVP